MLYLKLFEYFQGSAHQAYYHFKIMISLTPFINHVQGLGKNFLPCLRSLSFVILRSPCFFKIYFSLQAIVRFQPILLCFKNLVIWGQHR